MSFVRRVAVLVPALLLFVALFVSHPVFAQSSPQAAPSTPADSQALTAAPAGTTDVTTINGGSSPGIGSLSIVSLFDRADILVKIVLVLLLLA